MVIKRTPKLKLTILRKVVLPLKEIGDLLKNRKIGSSIEGGIIMVGRRIIGSHYTEANPVQKIVTKPPNSKSFKN